MSALSWIGDSKRCSYAVFIVLLDYYYMVVVLKSEPTVKSSLPVLQGAA